MSSPSYKCNLCGLEWGMGAGDPPFMQHQCVGSGAKQKTPEEMAIEAAWLNFKIRESTAFPHGGYFMSKEIFLSGYHAGYDAGFTQRKEWRKDG